MLLGTRVENQLFGAVPDAPIRLLGLSGSPRRASNSTAVLRGLRDALGLRAALDIFPLHAIPLYNENDDAEHTPESVRALRSEWGGYLVGISYDREGVSGPAWRVRRTDRGAISDVEPNRIVS